MPEGTRAVVLEVFHWLTPGETHWDSLWLRVATLDDLKNVPFEAGAEIDREPVPGRNKPYAPAEGETVRLNPPPFLWLPSGREVTYRLQVARNDRFEGRDVISLEGLKWCAEMLTRPLAPGVWYWRYGVDRPGLPTAWSRTRRFQVAADASPWVYPGRDAFAVPGARPRLFVRAGRLAELRERAKSGDLKATADALVRSLQRHLGEELVPEPKHLTGTGQTRSAQYLEVFVSTRPPMDVMERAGLAYLLTGDRACGEEAKRRILHFFSWDPKGSTSVSHNDEPAMWIMMRGVRAYDWTYDLFTPEEREKIEAVMRVRAADFYEHLRRRPFENNPYESHSGRIIGFLGEAALAFLPDWPEAREWLDYVTRIYWGVYPAWGKDDGGWNEGPGYWSAYMSFALHFVVALREATGIDLAQRPFFRSTPYYLLYLTPPYSNISPFGDGTQFRPSRPAGLMYQFSTLLRDPAIRWYSDALGRGASSDILGIVLKDDSLKGMPPAHLPQARHFEGVGLACLHTRLTNAEENVSFAMRSSPYGAVSHGHNDQNTFVLEAFGEPLAIASGYYPRYGSPHHDQWTRQTKAKCGITVDGGKGQDRGWHAKGAITAFVHGEGFDLVSGDATPAYGGRLTRAVREVIHVRPGIFVIRDDLASGEARRYEYWLHALDEMKVDAAAGTVTTVRPKATLRTRSCTPKGSSSRKTTSMSPRRKLARIAPPIRARGCHRIHARARAGGRVSERAPAGEGGPGGQPAYHAPPGVENGARRGAPLPRWLAHGRRLRASGRHRHGEPGWDLHRWALLRGGIRCERPAPLLAALRRANAARRTTGAGASGRALDAHRSGHGRWRTHRCGGTGRRGDALVAETAPGAHPRWQAGPILPGAARSDPALAEPA